MPRSIHHCTYGKNDTLLFSSLKKKKIFFVGFVLFFKKSLKVSYWLHLHNVKCCCYQSLYRTVQGGQILTNKVSFFFFLPLLNHYYLMGHLTACIGHRAA